MTLRRIGVLLVLCLMLSGLSLVRAHGEPLKVVATYSIVGEIVEIVGGENVSLTVLVGGDGDPHIYEPTPQDLIALAEADILFENGLELEPWIDALYEASGSTAVRVAVSDGIDVLEFAGHHDHDHDHAHGGFMDDDPMVGSRLIVNDFESGTVHVVDLRSSEVIATFDLNARPNLYTSPNGRYAFAVQMTDNLTNVIDSGVIDGGA